MRVDIWDVQAAKEIAEIDCGYPRNFGEKFRVDYDIGKGGFGTVRAVTDTVTNIQYACKSVRKKLEVPNVSVAQQAKHIDNLKREISILRKLRGTLSVVHFKGAYEDDESVHIVMEYCRGGELHHRIGRAAYSEKTVQRIMKCCLQCLAQCHSHGILHRDIKPGNFMWLTDEEDSPVKALDFGLAVYFKTGELPRTDLGLEGTPWFMAPEVLSSSVYPASDVWAAGVMAYQLLSGYLPFDDRRNPNSPALSIIWKGILTEEPKMSGKSWQDISEDAKDFVAKLLVKDPMERPSAKEALQHPWLFCEESALPSKPISHTVVQRIQRYCQGNMVKRSILELIAQELMNLIRAADPSVHGGRSGRGSSQAAMALLQRRFPSKAGSSLEEPLGPLGPHLGTQSAPADLSVDTQRPASFVSPFSPSVSFDHGPSMDSSMQDLTKTSNGHGESYGQGDKTQVSSREGSQNGRFGSRRNVAFSESMKQLEAMDDDQFRDEIGRRLQRRVNSVHGGTEFYKWQEGSKSFTGERPGDSTHGASTGARVAAGPGLLHSAKSVNVAGLQGKANTTHGVPHYWRMMRAAATLINSGKRPLTGDDSLAVAPGGAVAGDYLRLVGRTDAEREEQAKARRLALDVSAHGGEGYSKLVRQLSSGLALDKQLESIVGTHPSALTPLQEHTPLQPTPGPVGPFDTPPRALNAAAFPSSIGTTPPSPGKALPLAARLPQSPEGSVAESHPPSTREFGRRGQGSFKALMESQGLTVGGTSAPAEGPADAPQQPVGQAAPAAAAPAGCLKSSSSGDDVGVQPKGDGSNHHKGHKHVSWDVETPTAAKAGAGALQGPGSTGLLLSASDTAIAKSLSEQLKQVAQEQGRVAHPRQLADVLQELSFAAGNSSITRAELSAGLSKLGFVLEESELQALMDQLDLNKDGVIGKTEFLASQMDWNVLQEDCRDLWLQCAKRAFAALDTDGDGKLRSEELVGMLRNKLPAHEVDWALEDMLIDAGYADADEMDFEGFLRMAKAASYDSLDNLDQYEARLDPQHFQPELEPLKEEKEASGKV